MLCTLCESSNTLVISAPPGAAQLHHCQQCDLIFKNPQSHWGWDQQKHRYDQHCNDIENPGYVDFFEKLLQPLRFHWGKIPEPRRALDWGAGPGEAPVLGQLLRREGWAVDLYDPIYHPELQGTDYDLITSTEAIEHFLQPRVTLVEILRRLRTSGLLAGMTQFHPGPAATPKWWYVRDPTHVVFYSEKTFEWMAHEWKLKTLELKNPVFIFEKE